MIKSSILILLSTIVLETWNNYVSTQNKFETSYPGTWTKKDGNNFVSFLAPSEGSMDLFQENINITVQDLSKQPMTLDGFTKLSKDQVVSLLGQSAMLSLTNKICYGQSCAEMVYVMAKNPVKSINLDLKIKQIWFIKSNKAFVLTYTAETSRFNNYLGIADKILSSFKLG